MVFTSGSANQGRQRSPAAKWRAEVRCGFTGLARQMNGEQEMELWMRLGLDGEQSCEQHNTDGKMCEAVAEVVSHSAWM